MLYVSIAERATGFKPATLDLLPEAVRLLRRTEPTRLRRRVGDAHDAAAGACKSQVSNTGSPPPGQTLGRGLRPAPYQRLRAALSDLPMTGMAAGIAPGLSPRPAALRGRATPMCSGQATSCNVGTGLSSRNGSGTSPSRPASIRRAVAAQGGLRDHHMFTRHCHMW